jgi:hypothetical protein
MDGYRFDELWIFLLLWRSYLRNCGSSLGRELYLTPGKLDAGNAVEVRAGQDQDKTDAE